MHFPPAVQEILVTAVVVEHIIEHAIHIVGKAAQLHTPLAEMPEFVGDHRFEFTGIDAVHQAQTDLQVFFHRQEHTPETGVVKYTGIDIG